MKINVDNLKVGDFITAKNRCIMDKTSFNNAGKPALIIGKKYRINHIIPIIKTIVVISELEENHFFSTEIINKYFNK